MKIFDTSELNREIFSDVLEEVREHIEVLDQLALQLEADPSREKINELFRHVHSVKGDLGLVGLFPMVRLLQVLEDVLDAIRGNKRQFSTRVVDLTLLLLDEVLHFVTQAVDHIEFEYDSDKLHRVSAAISDSLQANDIEDYEYHYSRALHVLDPKITELTPTQKNVYLALGLPTDGELAYFYQLAQTAEERCDFWQGRIDRMMVFARSLLKEAQSDLSFEQVCMALFVHDLAMSCLPNNVLLKQGQYTTTEYRSMQLHVDIGTCMLAALPQWRPAQSAIECHHRELGYGGYPEFAPPINDIGQVLALTHMYESIIYGRSRLQQRRPLIRVVTELAGTRGVKFSPDWVDACEQVIRRTYRARH